MKIIIKKRALNAILSAAIYVEGMNTPGSGDKWANKIQQVIISLARSKAKYAFCKNSSLAKFNYRCFAYKDWIIAFRISKDAFEVCRFIYGPRLY